MVSGAFELYCKAHGILYQRPVPDAHQQNGVAEHTIQTIEFMMHTMLVDGNLPHWFWPLAAHACVHIKNCVPHSALPQTTTPFETILKQRANLSHICPFGSLITSRRTDSTDINKASQRGEEARFVGYVRDSKGYLIYFPASRAVRVWRDVEFHGFPISLPTPPLSELLWDDIPFKLEKLYQDPTSLPKQQILGQLNSSQVDSNSPQDGAYNG